MVPPVSRPGGKGTNKAAPTRQGVNTRGKTQQKQHEKIQSKQIAKNDKPDQPHVENDSQTETPSQSEPKKTPKTVSTFRVLLFHHVMQ